jgi:hypothetical protein
MSKFKHSKASQVDAVPRRFRSLHSANYRQRWLEKDEAHRSPIIG